MKKNENKIKVGVVGVGHMGSYHVNVLSQIKTIDFVGVFDKSVKVGKKIASQYYVKCFESYEKLMEQIDAIIIAVPTSLHYETARLAVENKKHVLVEKPLCNKLEDAKELVRLASGHKVKLFIGHVERYNAAVQELKKLVKKPPILWESKRISTYNKRPTDIGVALDLLIHDIDIAMKIIKSPIVDIEAMGKKVYTQFEDVLTAQIRFANNCLARFLVSRVQNQKERTLKINLKNSDIVLNFETQDIKIYKNAATNITTSPKSIKYKQQSSVERVFIHKENPLKLEVLDFINTILKDKEMDYESDLMTLETIFKIIEQI